MPCMYIDRKMSSFTLSAMQCMGYWLFSIKTSKTYLCPARTQLWRPRGGGNSSFSSTSSLRNPDGDVKNGNPQHVSPPTIATKPERLVKIDRSGLIGASSSKRASLPDSGTATSTPRPTLLLTPITNNTKTTPLVPFLRDLILMRGPMTVADFMRHCLSHPTHGYYSKGGTVDHSVFGTQGDFITSPEISQMFGELLGIWIVATWQDMLAKGVVGAVVVGGEGKRTNATEGYEGNASQEMLDASLPLQKNKKKVLSSSSSSSSFSLIECGPGRGTLTADILRVLARFPSIKAQVQSIHLVETSSNLRKVQAQTLQCTDTTSSNRGGVDKDETVPIFSSSSSHMTGPTSPIPGIPVHWYDTLDDVPTGEIKDEPSFILAHELFDALPVHQLVWAGEGKGWRERLVDVSTDGVGGGGGSVSSSFRMVRATGPTPASIAYTAVENAETIQKQQSSGLTTHTPLRSRTEGDVVEYCPIGIKLAHQMASRVAQDGGAALLIDYATDATPYAWSVRGIQRHKFVDNFLQEPGDVDLSADVDFKALRRAAQDCTVGRRKMRQNDNQGIGSGSSRRSGEEEGLLQEEVPAVNVHGPTTQGEFLQRMGIAARLQCLLTAAAETAAGGDSDGSIRTRLVSEANRLVHPAQMGNVYKVLAITPRYPPMSTSSSFFEASAVPTMNPKPAQTDTGVSGSNSNNHPVVTPPGF